MTKDEIFQESAVEQNVEKQCVPPPKYCVILNNDDFTPMDFVITVLQKFFQQSFDEATKIMLLVHYQGRAVCGIYTAEIAEMKVEQVNRYARSNEYPLLCSSERM